MPSDVMLKGCTIWIAIQQYSTTGSKGNFYGATDKILIKGLWCSVLMLSSRSRTTTNLTVWTGWILKNTSDFSQMETLEYREPIVLHDRHWSIFCGMVWFHVASLHHQKKPILFGMMPQHRESALGHIRRLQVSITIISASVSTCWNPSAFFLMSELHALLHSVIR